MDDNIQAGQTLLQALVHPVTGKVLLPAGTVLTDSYIERIDRQGLREFLALALGAPPASEGEGQHKGRDLDDFEIDIPELPDVILQFARPGGEKAAAAAAGAAAPAGGNPFAGVGVGQAQGAAPRRELAPAPPPGPRYHHNPAHFMQERALMGAMHAYDAFEREVRAGGVPSPDGIRRTVQEIADRIKVSQGTLAQGVEVRIVNQLHHLSHPVNVCMISMVVASAMGMDMENQVSLGMAALMHDIGKTAIPQELLDKVGPLTPQDVDLLRAHPLMGKRILDKLPWGNPIWSRVVHEHHERVDGSGYPQALNANTMHDFSKIVAVAEVYDALISDTSYRPRYSPELAYKTVKEQGEQMGLCPSVLRAFGRYVQPYPLHTWVQLDSQEIGQVVEVRRHNPYRPILKVGSSQLDLVNHPNRNIANSIFRPF